MASIKIKSGYKAFWLRAKVCAKLNNIQKAIEDYEKAHSLNPKDIVLIQEKADFYFENQKYTPAIKDYTTLISMDKDNYQYYYKRGLINLKASKRTDAMADFIKAKEMGMDIDIESLIPDTKKTPKEEPKPVLKEKEQKKEEEPKQNLKENTQAQKETAMPQTKEIPVKVSPENINPL